MVHNESVSQQKSELENLAQALQAQDFKIAHIPVCLEKQRAVEELLLIVGHDPLGQNIILKIRYAEDLVQSTVQDSEQPVEWGSILMFVAQLAAPIYAEQRSDLHHLNAVMNRACPLGGFAISREAGLIFQYKLMGPDTCFSSFLVAYVLEHISTILQQFMPLFYAYLDKEKSLSDLLQDVGGVS